MADIATEATKTTSDKKEVETVTIGNGIAGTVGNLAGAGFGLYYAHKKGSGFWGYVGYMMLFGTGGWIGGTILDQTILKK